MNAKIRNSRFVALYNSWFLDNIIILLLIVFRFGVCAERTNMTATTRMDMIFMFSVRFRWLAQASTALLTKINHTQNTRRTKLFDKQHKHHNKHAHTKQRYYCTIHTKMTKMIITMGTMPWSPKDDSKTLVRNKHRKNITITNTRFTLTNNTTYIKHQKYYCKL